MRAALALAATLLLTACAPGEVGGASVTVYAAASLRDAFEALGPAYETETGTELVLSFDASSALRAQIEQGAPADVFASADPVHARTLVDAGLTDGDTTAFATSPLAIVAAEDGPVDEWQDLAKPRVRVVAAGADVPITRYAEELVAELAALPHAPKRFSEAYRANVVSREDNVRAVLAKVEVGEGDAAIVYETDARSSGAVRTLALPSAPTVVAEYVVVTIDGATPRGEAFVEWLLGPAAQGVLREHGFLAPP